ncbi:MAG: LamG domain-containing protein, partial [Verrucomicrobiaceae bacterium]
MQIRLPRLTRGLLALCIACTLPRAGAVEVAGSLVIDLDAADFRPGSERWPQHSDGNVLTGDFVAKGSPSRQMVAGVPAVVFDGDGDHFVGPITTAVLHGPGAHHSVEVWVYQGNAREQESLVSWGKRWGPDGTFAGFRYGEDPDFGAIGRWGHHDMGFKAVPTTGRWHHLAYTYDGVRQAVYVDGVLDSSGEAGLLDAHDSMPIHLGVEICGDLKPEGLFTHFSGAMRRVRIHSGALSHAQVRANYEAERGEFPPLVGKPLQQSPMHRFSFSLPAADAPDGTTVVDSVGGLLATVRGNGAKFTGRALQLPGGPSTSAAYIDLPNGLISSRENLSIEFWETQSALRDWCRILSIGTNQSGEIPGPGGRFSGSETLTLFGNVGATPCNRFARSEGRYPNGGPDRNPAEYPDEEYGKQFHQVITYDKVLKEWHWYRDGVLMEVIPDLEGPTSIDDVNVWLGRSEFSEDLNFQGSFDELRIYNHALGEAEILGNFLAGPEKLNLGASAVAMNWTPVAPGTYPFSNSGGSDHWNTGTNGRSPNGPGSIATFASELAGDQTIELDAPVTLGSLNLGTRNRGGAYTLRAVKQGALTMDSGNEVAASITQLPGSPGNLIYAPLVLRSDTEVSNQSSQPILLGGTVSGGGAFVKGGNGPVILTGNGASHSGEVKV